jgi:hypothetical protein
MKRGPLTADELPHLEHRWAVISSFLDVASDATYTHAAGYTPGWRVYRGCMDGAIATCRALCKRFDLSVYSKDWTEALLPCTSEFKTDVRVVVPGASDRECEALWAVLVAANRCVCHLEDKLIDHNVTSETLQEAVRLVQSIIHGKLTDAGLPLTLCR